MQKKHFRHVTALIVSVCLSLSGGMTASASDSTSQSMNNVTVEGQTLNMTGLGNARQLGGYETVDGRHVKSDLLLRSGKLADATAEDIQILVDEYNLGYVIDFRTSVEIAPDPDPVIEGVINTQIRVLDENNTSNTTQAVTKIYTPTTTNPAETLLNYVRNGVLTDQMYIDVIHSETAQKGYRAFFQILLDNKEGKAVLWHCTGGKDRAGTAAVLLLSVLGVDRETILDDFALTNHFNAKKIAYMGSCAMELTSDASEINGVMYLTGVNRDFMELTLDTIDKEYGSIEAFLVNEIGLSADDFTELQAMYLE